MTVIYVGAQRKDGESVRIGCEIFKDLQNLRVEFITSTSSFYDAKLKSIGYLLEHLEPNDSLTIITGDESIAQDIRDCFKKALSGAKDVCGLGKMLLPGMKRFKFPIDIRGKSVLDETIQKQSLTWKYDLEVLV